MRAYLPFIVAGLASGSVYAIAAMGLVVTYKTSGVFNLAYGAQAFVSGAIYYDARVRHNLPIPVALVLAVFVAAPVLGFILDRVLFRYLRQAPAIAKLVTSLALLFAIPQITKLWFGQEPAAGTQGIVSKGDFAYNPFGDVYITRNDIATILATLGFAYVFGVQGVKLILARVCGYLWPVLSDLVLAAPRCAGADAKLARSGSSQISDFNYTQLVVVAISAAVVASLNSIPGAFLGGLALGVIQQLLDRYLPTGSILASNIRPALPFIALFLVLIFSPSLRGRRELTDPLAGVDPPPPALATATRSALLTTLTRVLGITVAVIAGYYIFFHASQTWLDLAIRATILSVAWPSP